MLDQEMLDRMKAPGDRRPTIWRGGVLQVWVTRACDKACFGCTQGSNLAGKPGMITVDQYAEALDSLKGYFGVIGMFGGNPAVHPKFPELCEVLVSKVPFEQRGIWCNNPMTAANAMVMRGTFNPHVSNLNVHLDQEAHNLFYNHWPECRKELKGLRQDSRHDGWWKSMVDLGYTEEERHDLISRCDVNQLWSAMIGVFRGELRGWVCEIMGAMSMLNQQNSEYPDTGLRIEPGWWKKPMEDFKEQVRFHCHHCSMPTRGHGELAIGGESERVTAYHQEVVRPKTRDRLVQLVVGRDQIHENAFIHTTDYVENGGRP